MKKTILNLIGLAALSAYAAVPLAPKLHATKYTVLVIKVEIPGDLFTAAQIQQALCQTAVDGFTGNPGKFPSATEVTIALQHPNAKILEYPLLYAETGVPATNDQTTVLLPEDFKMIDGKAVPEKKACHLGMFAAVSITQVENGEASFHLAVSNKELVGFDEYTVEDGIKVKRGIHLNAVALHLV